jgi:hypothetical protein
MTILLKTILFEMALSVSQQADNIAAKLKEFEGSHQSLMDYATKSFEFAGGHGTDRITFIINNELVLKIAKTPDSLGQNRREVERARDCLEPKHFTKLYAYSPDFYWLIAEKVNPILSHDIFVDILKNNLHGSSFLEVKNKGIRPKTLTGSAFEHFFLEYLERLKEYGLNHKMEDYSPWLESLANDIIKCDINPYDFHLENWGMRDNGDLVILDYGWF